MYKTAHDFANYILRVLAPNLVTQNHWVLHRVVGVNILNYGEENESNLEEIE